MDVNDQSPEQPAFPVFAFQKLDGDRKILLPDIDFLQQGWHRRAVDPFAYPDKRIAACFCGGSTGFYFDEADVLERALPRLRAAAFFAGNPRVAFRIAEATQGMTREAEDLVRRQPYFGPRMSWREQFAYRFLLSMDGNGAACSRLAIGLKSNSVVMKYKSPHLLHYFSALRPGVEFLPIADDRDVEPVLLAEEGKPGLYEPVARAGSAFFQKYLTRRGLTDYTAALLTRYQRVWEGAGE